MTHSLWLKTGQWHWRDQLTASLPGSAGFWAVIFFSFAKCLPMFRHSQNRWGRETAIPESTP
jgi:hypothetical protein